MTSTPPRPLPERKNGFAYGLDHFTVKGIRREHPARLEELLRPENIKGKRAQKAAQEDAKKLVKKAWIMAQLQHYDVHCPGKANVDEARSLLVKAVSDGRCRKVPQSILDIEPCLCKAFEPKKRAYEAQGAEHRISEAQRATRKFAVLGSPSAEANYNIDMFMKKYFIDESGNPDKSKTPDPMPLPGLNSRAQMHAAAERIPGLETHSGGEGKDRAVVVGWDRSAVWRVAGQIGNQQALKRQEREEAEWNQLMQKHELFVSQSSSGDMTNTFSIDDTRGTYIIKCDAMGSYSSEWSSVNNMRLRITNGARQGWVGIFDFNAIEGIMLLDKTKEGLASRVEGLKENDSFNGEDPDDFDSEQEQYNSRQTIGKKRKAVTAGQSSRASKTQKQSKATGGTVFLQWRGQETGEGEIQLDQSNQHVGQLKFSGTADFGFVGEEVHFEGYKIGILGGHATRSWNDYSEDVYERARVGRWH